MTNETKWEDAESGDFSELTLLDEPGPAVVGALVWQAFDASGERRRRNWETSIAARNSGLGLSLESGKVDAVCQLRRDAERIVEALGGKVVWS